MDWEGLVKQFIIVWIRIWQYIGWTGEAGQAIQDGPDPDIAKRRKDEPYPDLATQDRLRLIRQFKMDRIRNKILIT
jgi:hypothetical protein